jgi:hypothetical protein
MRKVQESPSDAEIESAKSHLRFLAGYQSAPKMTRDACSTVLAALDTQPKKDNKIKEKKST